MFRYLLALIVLGLGPSVMITHAQTVCVVGRTLCTGNVNNLPTSGIVSVEANGILVPQQPTLNFINGSNITIVCTNNQGLFRTDCTFTSTGGGGGSTSFSAITGGTNTTSAMTMGSGSSLTFIGSGIVNASSLRGVALSSMTGLIRGGSVPSASELTGDVITVGSNVATVISINGTAVPPHGATSVDQLLVTVAPDLLAYKVLPSCSGITNALTYNISTHSFSCNSISGGGGSSTTIGATWTAINDGSCQVQTGTWTGTATGTSLALGPPSAFTAGLQATSWVSATNTVSIQICNYTGSANTPGALVFGVSSSAGGGGGGSGTVASSTGLTYYPSSGTTVTGMGADFGFSGHTIASGSAGILDLHLSGASGLLLPGALSTGIVKVTTSTGAISILTAPTGTIVGTTDTQTLTNKSIAGSEINSSVVGSTFGGTGADLSATAGIVRGGNPFTASELSGDVTTSGSNVATVLKVHGVTYAASPSTDTTVIITAANTATYTAVTNCGDATHALAYTTSTHLFSCQAITASATAGGSDTQLQYNNATALGGVSILTYNGSTTLTMGASGILNMSATATSALKLSGSYSTGLMFVTTTTGAVSSTNLSGDATTAGSAAVTVVKINGVAYAASPATNTIPIITAANTATYSAVGLCGDATHGLGFDTVTHAFTCQAITGSAAAGGSTTQLQYNNATALGGIADFTYDGSHTIASASGGIVDLHLAGASGLVLPGGLATGIVKVTTSTGVISIAAAPTGAIVGTTDTQTLTNKSIQGSEINSGTVGSTFGGTGADLHINTGLLRSGNPFTSAELSGDATTSGSNAVTVVKVNGGSIPVSSIWLTSNSSAQIISMTSATATGALNMFTTSLQGVVPASGGGSTNFLRADGLWAVPAGGGGGGVSPGTNTHLCYYASSGSTCSDMGAWMTFTGGQILLNPDFQGKAGEFAGMLVSMTFPSPTRGTNNFYGIRVDIADSTGASAAVRVKNEGGSDSYYTSITGLGATAPSAYAADLNFSTAGFAQVVSQGYCTLGTGCQGSGTSNTRGVVLYDYTYLVTGTTGGDPNKVIPLEVRNVSGGTHNLAMISGLEGPAYMGFRSGVTANQFSGFRFQDRLNINTWLVGKDDLNRVVISDIVNSRDILRSTPGAASTLEAPSNLLVGATAVLLTATPSFITMGGSYSSTAGANLKIKVWTDGTSSYGLGVSSSSLDYVVSSTGLEHHTFYVGSTAIVTISAGGCTGCLISPNDTYITATAGQTSFSPGFTATSPWVFVNGVKVRPGASFDYQVSAGNVVFNAGLTSGDIVEITQ